MVPSLASVTSRPFSRSHATYSSRVIGLFGFSMGAARIRVPFGSFERSR